MYTIRGSRLYDKHNRRIAFIRGEGIYDDDNRMVATMHGNYLYDSDHRVMMTIRGENVYDAKNVRIGTLLEAQRSIEGGKKENLCVALWYCFIR
jgi:hypothetical protein